MSMLSAGICKEDEEDDDEFNNEYDDEDNNFGVGYLFVISELQVTKKAKWAHQQLNWLAHVKKQEHENIFSQTYCMSFQAFTALIDMLYQYIAYDYLKYGYTCTQQPVHAEITIALGLCWLSGGSYLS
jgi:hypothetical protein